MTATIYRFPPPEGYSLHGDCDMDGVPLWYVNLANADGGVCREWTFWDRAEAVAFLAEKKGGAHGVRLPIQPA